ncbi:membrane protein [Azotosporobacter soli]|uniref:YczE/YyaS/YitT family protein n=1 Tax=Azotosporobacter soli TaxID=3055040 RepID=UPI0031FE76A1
MRQRLGNLFFGLFLYGLGIVVTLRSNLGTTPWDALHAALTAYIPLTMGQIGQVTGLIIILLSMLIGMQPGWGTLANMYFIGVFIDFFLGQSWLSAPDTFWWQLAMLLGGVWIIGWASYFYMVAALGAGPRDSFMVGAVRKSGWPVWKIRTAIEGSVALSAYALGGPVGIGTVIIALTLGPAIQFSFRLMGKRAQDIEHEGWKPDWRKKTGSA